MKVLEKIEAAKRYVQNRISGKPLYVGLNITEACNADCDFCGYRRTNDYEGRMSKGLPSYTPIYNDLKPIVLSFLGGEPFSRKDLEKLVKEAKYEANVPYVQVTTNGSFLSKEKYIALSEAGLNRLNISLDYVGEKHDRSRGIPGLYEKITGFLEDAKGVKGAKISFNTIVMADGISDVKQIVDLAQKYGTQITLFPYSPVKNGNCNRIISLEKESARKLFRELKDNYSSVVTNPEATMSGIDEFIGSRKYGGCDAGRSFMWVRPDGTYMGCIDIPQSSAKTLEEVRKFKDRNTCTACYLPCRAMSETAATTKNPLTLLQIGKHFASVTY